MSEDSSFQPIEHWEVQTLEMALLHGKDLVEALLKYKSS